MPNNRLAYPSGLASPFWKILDPPLVRISWSFLLKFLVLINCITLMIYDQQLD